MIVTQEALQDRIFTYQELQNLEVDENEQYELIDGKLMKRASPTTAHQRIVKKISMKMDTFISKKKLGELFFAPIDVVLDEYNMVQPNILFVSTQKQEIVQETNIAGMPDLVVEVLSPSSIARDRDIKMKLYAQFNINEYWIVDPLAPCIEIYALTENEYRLHSYAYEKGEVESIVLDKFKLKNSSLL